MKLNMGFENIESFFPEKQKLEPEAAKEKTNNETILGSIRKKTNSVAKGLVLVGGLSLASCKFDKYSPGTDPEHQPTELALHFSEEKLSKNDFLKLCQENPEKAFVTASLYENEEWQSAALEQAAKNDPILALQYYSRYQDNPQYNTIISLAIQTLRELDKKGRGSTDEYSLDADYIIGRNIAAWINTPAAHDILKEEVNNEIFFISNFKDLSKSSEGRRLGEQIIKSATESNPYLLLEHIDQYASEPWAENVIKEAGLNDPYKFFNIIFLKSTEDNISKKIRNKLVIEISSSRPDEAAGFRAAFGDEPDTSLDWSGTKEGHGLTAILKNSVTKEGHELTAILKNSGDKNLELIPKIRQLVFNRELQYDEIKKIVLLLDDISSGKMTINEASKNIKNPEKYFKILTNIVKNPNYTTHTLAEDYMEKDRLRVVRKINNLHERPEKERFNSIEHSKAEELYLTLSYGEEEIFTSSFNGIFDRLMTCLKNEHLSGAQLLQQENFVKFRTFIRICTEFGRWNDFLATMNPIEQKNISQKFISDIDKTQDPLREAVSIAEVTNTTSNPLDLALFKKEIQQQILLMENTNKPNIELLYKLIATTLLREGENNEWLNEIEKTYKLPSLSQIKSSELFNKDGLNVQEYFFYGDEDGRTSFANFLTEYKKDGSWSIKDAGTYVVLESHKNNHGIRIYANKPEAEDDGPEEIALEIKKQNLNTSVIVHRGHSYHASETVRRIPASAKIVSLGSCGGYRNISEVLEKSPNAHIISTKGTGTKYVNDPLFKLLNEEILSGHDIVWSDFWGKAEHKITNSKFSDYVAPNKNFGAVFVKAYNQALENKNQIKK